MRVLIVGSTSAIGEAITNDLRLAGADVLMAGRRSADVALDLADDDSCRVVPRGLSADVVVNAAAVVPGSDPSSASLAWKVNADGAGVVARIANAVGARQMIQLSTVYAGQPDRYPGPRAYPDTKAAGEVAAGQAARRTDLIVTVLRLTHVYDAAGRCRPNQELPYRFADLAAANETIELHGDGRACRDYLHLDDAVRAVHLATTTPMPDTLTIGSPAMPTIREIAEAAREAFESESPIRLRADVTAPAGMLPVEPGGWERLGGEPTVGIAQGFARMRSERQR